MIVETLLAASLSVSLEASNDSWPDSSKDDLDTFALTAEGDRWHASWHILTHYKTLSRADEARLNYAPVPDFEWARLGVYASGNLGGEAVQVFWHDALNMNDRRGLAYDTLRMSPEFYVAQKWHAAEFAGFANCYNTGARLWVMATAPCGWGRVGPYAQVWGGWMPKTTVARVHDQLAPVGVRWEITTANFVLSIEGAREGTRGGIKLIW